MVKKKNLTKAFFVSFIIGTLIFSLGLFLGYGLDVLRIKDASTSISDIELETLNYITSNEFIDVFGGNHCDLVNSELEGLSVQLFEIGQTLVKYEKRNIFSGTEYKLLKSKYFLLEVRAYTLFTKLKNQCDSDYDLILYFYDQNQDDSENQGYILDKLVKSDNVTIFSFDRDFEIISFLINRYDIKKSPTIIINEDIKFEGITYLGELREAVNQ
ncbi:hypothetical protein J4446_01475 [Candidatus Woesearchaeota archaeon]|nr:hypothetical protein [Candidatus Woesearchaeota archaeon]